jgi:hypothetical protein
MPDIQLVDELIAAAERLIDESVSGIVDGDDVARAIGRDPGDPRALMHHAFREIERLGVLQLDAWGGGMGLPHGVQRPSMVGRREPVIGHDNTYVGPGPVPSMGTGNTIWTAADACGNVNIPGGTAVGADTRADSTSVAVGARAKGGDLSQLPALLAELQQIFHQADDAQTEQAIEVLRADVQASSPDSGKIREVWNGIQGAATMSGAAGLVEQISALLAHLHI